MKQATNNKLLVEVGVDVSLCEKIEFRFKQKDIIKDFVYPSEKAEVVDERTIALWWTKEDKALFKNDRLYMDTRIELKDSLDQPDTDIVILYMEPSLFEVEVE